MFLPRGWLIAVLPPTEESTCARRVVCTWMNGIPRFKTAPNPATQGDDERIAAAVRREQGIEHAFEAGPALGLFTVLDQDRNRARHARLFERAGHALQIERRDGRVGHHRHLCRARGRRIQACIVQQARSDMDWVGAFAERYAERLHVPSRRSRRSFTSVCTLCLPVSTTRSA